MSPPAMSVGTGFLPAPPQLAGPAACRPSLRQLTPEHRGGSWSRTWATFTATLLLRHMDCGGLPAPWLPSPPCLT